ncbi:TetR/AcrR family transcriptional regulator [Bordetella pertussis]|uniref:TetR/AcrR family transcriptional regulator n=1 Tax=Bordetella pertussis TaxID=520 RepID=UPI0007102D36|nr:TetR/AcrR family transcriptional regulator [Bordetella pertussis]
MKATPAQVPMKERIKEVATDMLIAHGSSGFRFQQIAQALDCTRGNIHYHYRHKHELVEDVTIEYCQRTIGHFDQIWLSDSTLSQKIQLSMQFNEMRYLKRNPQGDTSHPWSLIARMRLESALITPAAREALARYSHELQRSVVAGVRRAVEKGELRPDTPVEMVALPIIEMANSADPIPRDAGRFDRLRQMYQAVDRLIHDAYGMAGHRPAP